MGSITARVLWIETLAFGVLLGLGILLDGARRRCFVLFWVGSIHDTTFFSFRPGSLRRGSLCLEDLKNRTGCFGPRWMGLQNKENIFTSIRVWASRHPVAGRKRITPRIFSQFIYVMCKSLVFRGSSPGRVSANQRFMLFPVEDIPLYILVTS
ncbi:hypothetical protein F5884DRAFT_356560 [Xylogone sp. PMI_703]|nr:hypothetical protein F5884DRAFT_356560 [Xylogone sp. PMI_703]